MMTVEHEMHRDMLKRSVYPLPTSVPSQRYPLPKASLFEDDRLLVLLLIVLLWQNGACKELILALVYIALG